MAKADQAPTVLILDDDRLILSAWRRRLAATPFQVVVFQDPSVALEHIAREPVDVAIVDYHMPAMNGMVVLEKIRAAHPRVEVVMLTGVGSPEIADEAISKGAYEYLDKSDTDDKRAVLTVQRAIESSRSKRQIKELEDAARPNDAFEQIIGSSPAIERLRALAKKVAGHHDSSVLIFGENGTGKERLARAVHAYSNRSHLPLVEVDFGAMAKGLLESELFGHVKGAFTGADKDRVGLATRAHGGTLFLDEIGELPLNAQATLLRLLQEHTVRPVGSEDTHKVDVRVIAATNRDLKREVERGAFREDLYWRLNRLRIEVPPLRERGHDVLRLAHQFMQEFARHNKKTINKIEPAAQDLLLRHRWNGNVRELQGVIDWAVMLCTGPQIGVEHLPDDIRNDASPTLSEPPVPEQSPHLTHLSWSDAKKLVLDEFAVKYLVEQLARFNGNITQAANAAGMDRANFRRLCRGHAVVAVRDGDGREPSNGNGRPRAANGSNGTLTVERPVSAPATIRREDRT